MKPHDEYTAIVTSKAPGPAATRTRATPETLQ
jgi:hypothetical protein